MMHYLIQQQIERDNRRWLQHRLMEEGRVDPPVRPSPICRYIARIVVRRTLTMLSLAMVAYFFVLKYKYHDPEMQHPLLMALCVLLALSLIPTAFLCTQD